MTRQTAIRSLAALCALMLGGASPTLAQQTVRWGHLFPTTHFQHIASVELADLITQKTGGRLRIDIFPASQLGNEKEMTEQVRSGALQIHVSGGSIHQYVPELQVTALPGLWKGHDHVLRVLGTDAGKQLIEMTEKKNVGIKVLTFVTTGERHFMGRKKPVVQTAEFGGIKIRVDTAPASAAIWRALKANPVPIAFAEVYSSLQTGVIDAAEQPPCGALGMKFYEQAKYITTTGHQFTVQAFMVNQKWYDGLSADLRGQIKAAIDEWLPSAYQLAKGAEAGCMAKMKELGAEVHVLKDADAFRAALIPIQKEFGEKYNVGDLIAKIKAIN